MGGTPSIYYGDEQAYRGLKEERPGGDDAVRPAFPSEGPSGLAPEGWSTYRLHQELIGLRRRHPSLHRATSAVERLNNRQIVYRSRHDDRCIVVAINLDDRPFVHRDDSLSSVLAGSAVFDTVTGAGITIHLGPRSWAVLA